MIRPRARLPQARAWKIRNATGWATAASRQTHATPSLTKAPANQPTTANGTAAATRNRHHATASKARMYVLPTLIANGATTAVPSTATTDATRVFIHAF